MKGIECEDIRKLNLMAVKIRKHIIEMLTKAKSGHPGHCLYVAGCHPGQPVAIDRRSVVSRGARGFPTGTSVASRPVGLHAGRTGQHSCLRECESQRGEHHDPRHTVGLDVHGYCADRRFRIRFDPGQGRADRNQGYLRDHSTGPLDETEDRSLHLSLRHEYRLKG